MNLKEWRKEKGLRQEDLADKLGSVQSTYQGWENGVRPFPPDIQAKIRKLGFTGPFPELGREVTLSDLNAAKEELRGEIRIQAAWVREEIRKENTTLAADLQAALKLLVELRSNLGVKL